MPCTDRHPEYVNKVDSWCKIDNVLQGRAKQYISDIEPRFARRHAMYDAQRDYLAERSCKLYREGAVFINFSLQTLNAITALALNAPATTEDLPPELEYLEKDVTGNKLSLDQLKQKLISECVAKGRIGLFTDYPNVDPTLDKATQKALKLGPRMYTFESESVFNWKTRVINGIEVLSLVVISKSVQEPDVTDKFTWKMCTHYLVLELDGDGYYTQSELDKGGAEVVKAFSPMANGKKLTQIPFTFVGSENNDPHCDICPLESLVDLNIGHLRNSAVYEDNLKKYGRGTLVVESSIEDFAEYYKNRPLILGTDEGYFVGEHGSFTVVQLAPAQEAAVAMNQKQEQMIMMGAHIVVSNPTNISAETTKLNMGEKISMLNTIVGNVEDALNEHFGYCDMFMGNTPKTGDQVYIQLSREFLDKVADPLVMGQLLAAMNGGAIPKRIYLNYLQSVNLLDASEDLEAVSAEADTENPFSDLPPPSQFGNNKVNNHEV